MLRFRLSRMMNLRSACGKVNSTHVEARTPGFIRRCLTLGIEVERPVTGIACSGRGGCGEVDPRGAISGVIDLRCGNPEPDAILWRKAAHSDVEGRPGEQCFSATTDSCETA